MKTKLTNRIVSMVLTFMLVAGLIPTVAFATTTSTISYYDPVSGETKTAEAVTVTQEDVNNNPRIMNRAEKWYYINSKVSIEKIMRDHKDNTTNIILGPEGELETTKALSLANYNPGDLNVYAQDKNQKTGKITCHGNNNLSTQAHGIYISKGNVNVYGGTLEGISETDGRKDGTPNFGNGVGIFVSGALLVNGGSVIGRSTNNSAIYTESGITLQNGATLLADGKNSWLVNAGNNMNINVGEGCIFKLQTDNQPASTINLMKDYTLTVDGGLLESNSGISVGTLEVKNRGKVICTCDEYDEYGLIHIRNRLIIDNGTVVADLNADGTAIRIDNKTGGVSDSISNNSYIDINCNTEESAITGAENLEISDSIIKKNNNATVIGNPVINMDLTIDQNTKLVVPQGSKLAIAEGTNFVNNGEIDLTQGGILEGNVTGIGNIKYPLADYTIVDEAIAAAQKLDRNQYVDFSGVEAALNAVVEGKNINEQEIVNGYAAAINKAIGELVYKDADYTAVNEAIAKAMGLTKDHYIDFHAVDKAIEAVVEGKNITEQEIVNEYAASINKAIGELVYKDADYTAVNEAIVKAKALDKELYVDFSAVDKAVKDVVEGKNITEQKTVNGYAAAINKAIGELVYKDADYTAVNEAIAKAKALDKDLYVDFSAVDRAVKNVVEGKNITEQKTVNGYAAAINKAIGELVYKDADYTAVNEAIAKAKALDKELYVDFSAVDKAVKDVVEGKNITEQTTVNGYAASINKAISELVYKDADYTAVNEAIAKAKALDKDLYVDFSEVDKAVKNVVEGKNITEQTTVNGYAAAINKAISELVYKDADYTAVNDAIAKAMGLTKDHYIDFRAVDKAIEAVVEGKNITEQEIVNEYAVAINKAVEALVYKNADYAKVDEAIATIPEDLELRTESTAKAVNEAKAKVVRNLDITHQSEVDKMAEEIVKAVEALVYRDADYAKVDKAIASAKNLESSLYEDFTAVNDAVIAVVKGKNITEQEAVDKMAEDINSAIKNLVRITTATVDKSTGKTDVKARGNKAVLAPEEVVSAKEITVEFGKANKVTYDKGAVEKIKEAAEDATKIEFMLKEVTDFKDMTEAQKKAVGKNRVYEVTVVITKADGTVVEVHDFKGGKSTISVPYTKTADGNELEVYRVETDGTLKLMHSSYKDRILTWITDGHSFYMVKETKPESTGTTEKDTPKTGDKNSMLPWLMVLGFAIAGAGIIFSKKNSKKED